LEKEQAFSIQFSSIDEATGRSLMDDVDLPYASEERTFFAADYL
jgi:hypothetical protein